MRRYPKPAGDRGVHGFGTWLSLVASPPVSQLRQRPAAGSAGPARVVRRIAHPAWGRLRCARRRSGDAARPQRRRQDDDVEVDHGDGRQADRLNRLRRSADDRPRQQPDRPFGHRHLSRGARYLRQPERRGDLLPPPPYGRLSDSDILQLFPNLRERFASRGTHLSAASSRCWRSAAFCARERNCCCSMNRPRSRADHRPTHRQHPSDPEGAGVHHSPGGAELPLRLDRRRPVLRG